MKKMLHLPLWIALLLTAQVSNPVKSQTVILTEDFKGFTSGTHTTPSTSDVSLSLDTKTIVPGWTGGYIYSAGGEIKLGTSTMNGWIETPAMNISSGDGSFTVSFDICRWPGDATRVQLLIDGTAVGDPIQPGDNFERVKREFTGGTGATKLRIASLAKRFFLDNLTVEIPLQTGIVNYTYRQSMPYAVRIEGTSLLRVYNTEGWNRTEVYNIAGLCLKVITNKEVSDLTIDMEGWYPGVYVLKISFGKRHYALKVLLL
jgi:hypothetical protein